MPLFVARKHAADHRRTTGTLHAVEPEPPSQLSPVPPDILAAVRTIRQAQRELNGRFMEREQVIELLIFALFTGQHALLLGRTGTGKSSLIHAMLNAVAPDAAGVFQHKASVEDRKDEYFGPLDPHAYRERGAKVRRTRGTLLDANFAFIDEIFDTTDDVLRDVMMVLLDRHFQEGAEHYQASLRTCFVAGNYLRENVVTEAVLDRFMFKILVPSDLGVISQFRIDLNSRKIERGTPFVELPMLDRIVAIARGESDECHVEVPADVALIKALVFKNFQEAVKRRLGADARPISGRRQHDSLDLLRLVAVLDGRDRVQVEDLRALRHVVGLVGGEDGEDKLFERALDTTLQRFRAGGSMTELKWLSDTYQVLRGQPSKVALIDLVDRGKRAGLRLKTGFRINKSARLRGVLENFEPSHAALGRLRDLCLNLLD